MPVISGLGFISAVFYVATMLLASTPALSQSTRVEVEAESIDTHAQLTTEQIEASLGREKNAEGQWVDASHKYIGTKADDLAIYLDRFFGTPIDDLESAYSTIRFVTGFEWDGDDGTDQSFRLRGNVHLPRINDKLSLVFNTADKDEISKGNDNERESESDDNRIGIQLNAREGKRSRFDLTLSASSDPNLKPGARYRYKADLAEWGRLRYTARIDYSNRNRFRQRHSVELDYITGETSLLRWSNRFENGQVSEGLEWGSALSWRYGYSMDSAIAFVLSASGKTDPDVPGFILTNPAFEDREFDGSSLITNYGVVVRLRNRLYKDWLYVEFEPGYTLRKRYHLDDRHGVFYGRVNFEIFFNRGRERQRKSSSKATNGQSSDTDTTAELQGT